MEDLARLFGIFAGTMILTLLGGMGLIAYGQSKFQKSVTSHVAKGFDQVKGEVTASIAPTTAKADEALNASQAAYNAWQRATDVFTPMINVFHAEVTASRDERGKLADQLAEEKAANHDKDIRILTYQETVDKLIKDYERVQQQLKDRDEDSERRDQTLVSLQQQVDDVGEDRDATRLQLAAMQQELDATKADLAKTRVELDQAVVCIAEITRDRDAERTLAAEQKRTLEQELAAEHVKVEQLQRQVGEQQARITFLEGEVARLTNELASRPVVDQAAPTLSAEPPPDAPKPTGGTPA